MNVDHEQFDVLLEKLLDGRLGADDRAFLRSALNADGELRTQYIETLQMEASLRAIHGKEHVAVADGIPTVRPVKVQSAHPRRSRTWWAIGTATALLMACVWWFNAASPTPEVLAQLQDIQGDIYVQATDGVQETSPAKLGRSIYAGQGVRTVGLESSVAIVYIDGTRLVLDADTSVKELTGSANIAKRVFLVEGFLTADVAKQPQGRPMILATERSEVRVLGTKFGLSSAAEATYIEIEEGAVELTRTSDGRSLEVEAGFSAVVTDEVKPLASQPLEPRFDIATQTFAGFSGVTLSADGRTMAALHEGHSGEIAVWDTASGERRTLISVRSLGRVLALSPDGKQVAAATNDPPGALKIWNTSTGELEATLNEQTDSTTALAFSAVGNILVAFHDQGTLALWDIAERKTLAVRHHPAALATLSTDGSSLLTVNENRTSVTVYDVASGASIASVPTGKRPNKINSLAISADRTFLAVGDDRTVKVWNLKTSELRCAIPGRTGRTSRIAFSPTNAVMATGQATSIALWDLNATHKVATLEGHAGRLNSLAFSPDGRLLVAGAGLRESGAVKIWDVSALPPQAGR